jgi:plasmid maintenance system killer protein
MSKSDGTVDLLEPETLLTVRANWRITFKFEHGKTYDVNLEDYH